MIIGYTAGVYDMFHIGHLNILKRAKEQCDYLIVGVSTDELVQQEKHKSPIIPFKQRMEIVKAIKYVDEVIPQFNKDKLATYLSMENKFQTMFVGSDWQVTTSWIKYEKEFSLIGVSVVYLPHTDGISSTMLREKMRSNLSLMVSKLYIYHIQMVFPVRN